ncbi:protein of unknown function (DUF2341), partial [Thermoplasmatales archaeon SCGC AB-539-N05]
NTTGTANYTMLWPDDEAELISGNCSETIINSTTRIINISFEPKSQVRYAGGENNWWHSNWQKRKSIYLNVSSGETEENYTVLLNISYDSNMNNDFSDLRFIRYADNTTMLDYWIESQSDGSWCNVWVEFRDNITTANQTLAWMYYNNSGASNISNEENSFVFFDDFEDGTMDKWTVLENGILSVNSSQAHRGTYSLQVSEHNNDRKTIVANNVNEENILLDTWWRLSEVSNADMSVGARCNYSNSNFEGYETNMEGSGGWTISKWVSNSWNDIYGSNEGSPTTDTWMKLTVIINGTNMKILQDDSQIVPPTGWQAIGSEFSNGSIFIRTWRIDTDDHWWVDDVKVRKYIDPEPTYSIGSEQDVNGVWNSSSNATNNLYSWNFNITVTDNSSAKAWKVDEYGVYKYTFIEPSQNWVGVTAIPGGNDTSSVVAVNYSSNYNFSMTIWFEENLTNQTWGTTIPIANNVDILNDTDSNDDINTGDITFNGIEEINAVDIFNTSGTFSKNNASQTVDVQFNVRIPIGTMWGEYIARIAVKIIQKN